MLPHEGAESLFWHATSPSNSLILTWQNAAYDRDANCPTNLQIELFSNGTYVYRYDDHTEHHAVIYLFDQAYAVYLFGNLLGADVYVKRLEPFGYLKRTCLVGRGDSNNPFYGDSATYESQPCCDANAVRRSSFSKHFFAMSNGLVFDGCAGPVLGTIGLDAYIQMSVDSSRSPVGSRPGTVADVFDYTDVRRFK